MDRAAEPATLVRCLSETAARVEAVGKGLSAAQLLVSPAPGGWSPNQILWHLRAQADVYGEHISRILDEDTPRWRHVSPRARMKKARYDQLPFDQSFAAFARQRAGLVALLEGIPPEAWQRFALVRVEQRESRLTLHERVRGMAMHEQIHCAQIEEVAAALRGPA
jgi:hypothetical protein